MKDGEIDRILRSGNVSEVNRLKNWIYQNNNKLNPNAVDGLLSRADNRLNFLNRRRS